MNRRGFLSLLGLGSAGLVLDPERLLWVPGQKTIFLPAVQPFTIGDYAAFRREMRLIYTACTTGGTLRLGMDGR